MFFLLDLSLQTGASAQAVVPVGLGTREGNEANVFPFNCLGGPPSMRYQQVYTGSSVGSGQIMEIRFRQDGTLGSGFAANTTENVTVRLSTTSASPLAGSKGLSPIFEDNVGADLVTVYTGDLELSSASSTDVPRPFDIVIPLQADFVFEASAGGNLLLDVTLPSCWTTTWFDSETASNDEISRAVAPNAASSEASFIDSRGLVTQFVLAPSLALIFADGFESGDTSAWGLTVPPAKSDLQFVW